MNDQRILHAVTALMALVPAHRRLEVKEPCQTLLALGGEKLSDHMYLFEKRPKKVMNTKAGVYLPPRLADRQYGFSLEIRNGDEGHDNTIFLARGLSSLHEISRFVDRIPETVEGWMNQKKRTQNGVTEATHSRLEGFGHIIRFWKLPEQDRDFQLPDLFQTLDELKKQQPKARWARKY